jgi:sterol desaturase/sphingolipid hydroxylase (fatty acid hydroxylase superfamily)
MTEGLGYIWDIVRNHLTESVAGNWFTDTEGLFYWGSLLAYVTIAGVLLALHLGHNCYDRSGVGPGRSIGGMFRALFPKKVYLHPSAIMDYKVVLLELFTMRSGAVYLAIGAALLASGNVENFWVGVLGEPESKIEVTWAWGFAYAAAMFLFTDFLYFFMHYLGHEVNCLWELHKCHHSADVLTPATTVRFHPLEMIWTNMFSAIYFAVLIGTAEYFFDDSIAGWALWSFVAWNIFFQIYTHFFHTHIWISYGPANRILYSPAHHRIHHGAREEHWNKNMGSLLSIWDQLFGTHYLPNENDRDFPLGLGVGVNNPHSTLKKFYIDPCFGFLSVLGETVTGPRRDVPEFVERRDSSERINEYLASGNLDRRAPAS